jgi:hypothetical protein
VASTHQEILVRDPKFRELLKRTAETDALPDYRIRYDPESEQAVFYSKNTQLLAQYIADTSGY